MPSLSLASMSEQAITSAPLLLPSIHTYTFYPPPQLITQEMCQIPPCLRATYFFTLQTETSLCAVFVFGLPLGLLAPPCSLMFVDSYLKAPASPPPSHWGMGPEQKTHPLTFAGPCNSGNIACAEMDCRCVCVCVFVVSFSEEETQPCRHLQGARMPFRPSVI